MVWFTSSYQVAIVLQGRQAGKKVVILKQVDESNNKEKAFPYAIVAGIERYPRKVTRRMGQKKVQRRSKVKPFIKVLFVQNCTIHIY
jgi:large subunit ribosomal protein L27e